MEFEDPMAISAKAKKTQYTFGKKLTGPKELLPKKILLDKRGKSVYFVMRDYTKKIDQIMRAELVSKKSELNINQVELEVNKIYESFSSRIIYLDFDHLTE